MTPQNDLTAHALQALRRQGSVLSSADLQRLLGVSQPTVSRALAPLIQSGQVQKMGEIDNWAATAQRMAERQLLRPGDARTLRLLEAYGQLIANTDRHYGNISLVLDGDDWALSPTYDMLPMLYAPVGGELVARDFTQRALQPSAATLSEWAQAQALAHRFWQAVAQDARVSAPFRAIAQENAGQIGL